MTPTPRLRWSTAAFERRVMLSSKRLFLVVEGRRLDRPFYDSLLGSNDEAIAGGYEVILCEEVWAGAGGKESALQIFEDLRKRRRLRQATKRVDHCIAFAVDLDFDGVLSRKKRTPHLIYTQAPDVEAEILLNGDLARALSLTLSVTMADASSLANKLRNYVEDLADCWRDWITLCCVAVAMRSRSRIVHPSKYSAINDDTYGSVCATKLSRAELDVRATRGDGVSASVEQWVRSRVRGVYERGRHPYLVKGKYLPAYLAWRINPLVSGGITDTRRFQQMITHIHLSTLNFKGEWTTKYHDQISALLTDSA